MKKAVLIPLFFGLLAAAFSLEVNRTEISPTSGAPVIEFINYTGPQSVVNTAAEIRAIGSGMGSVIRPAALSGTPRETGDGEKYRIIHAVDPSAATGFDADILILGPQAGVDHIDNIHRILSAYLSSAYGYSENDSSTLAVFITAYNAVNRGKIDFFRSRYKQAVLGWLEPAKVGIALKYDEWPGNTQLVVPLSEPRLAGTLSSIDTSAISSPEVVSKMREDDGAGIDDRKKLADIKEKEADQAASRATESQKAAADAKKAESDKKTEAAEAKKEAGAAVKEAEKARSEAEANPGDEAARQKAEDAEKKAQQQTAEAEKKEEELAQIQQEIAKKEEESAKDQTLADKKESESRTDKKEVAADEQKAEDARKEEEKRQNEAALASAEPAWTLRLTDDAALLSELVQINLVDGKILKTSPVNSIRGRTIYDTGTHLVAIAGKKSGSGAIRLVLIDPKSLEMAKQGEDPIAEQSVLVKGGNDWYAVIEGESGNFVVGRFDQELAVKAKSAVQVNPATAIVVTPRGLLVQNKEGGIRLLRATDLVDQSR